ncbi:hypothetical protein HJG60_010776 [Phyllostomus discolor]|uniref:Uncharacterized protein n=1 Tax=Phyllostomus discolor TaxID=89673 RepID=A0A834A7H9_9CHIR|nr:hypothetical protein HJG60_010776 [Phyllostomus discolor]
MWHLLMAHQQKSSHPFSSGQSLSCFLSHVAKREHPKAAWSQLSPKLHGSQKPVWLPCLGLNPSASLPLQPHFRLLPQSVTPASIPVLSKLYWAAIVSPGRHGPVVWSQSSPSSHAGAATGGGSCLPAASWVEITPIPLAQSTATTI